MNAEPSIPLFHRYTVNLILVREPNRYLLSLTRKDTTLTGIFKSITGIDISKLFFMHLFSGPCSIGVTYTNAKESGDFPFKIKSYPLEDMTRLPKGLSLFFSLRLPQCGNDKVCAFMKKLVGDRAFKFVVENLGSSPRITLEAPLPIKLKIAGIDIYNIRFGASFGTDVKFGLTHAEMDIQTDKDNKLHFVGDMVTNPILDVEMKFAMEGMWRKAFFIPFLAIGNVIVRFRVSSECPVCVSAGEFGGELWLGYNCQLNDNTTKCIMGRGYYGTDAEEPENNYFFFNINQFSYRRVLIAVGIPIDKVPVFNKMLEYWLMEKVLFSKSMVPREVPHGNTTQQIPAGIIFKGTITFLWTVKVNAKVHVKMFNGITTGVFATIWTNPVKLGEYLHLTASEDDKKGAIFELKASLLPLAFLVRLSARLTIPVLKIRVNVLGNITIKGIEFHFDTRLYILDIAMDLSASFKEALKPKSFKGFMAKGDVKPAGLNLIWTKVREVCNIAKRKAEAFLKHAKEEVAKISKNMKGIIANKAAAKKVKEEREAAMKKAKETVKAAVEKVDKLCKIKNCKVCGIPNPCIKKKCSCAVKYPCGWGKWCCKHICIPYPSVCGTKCLPVKPKCLLLNAACLPLRVAAEAAKKAATATLNAANKALETAQKGYMVAAKAFAEHNPILEAAKAIMSLAEKAVEEIVSLVDKFDFKINRILFKAELGATTKGTLAVKMDVATQGKQQTLGLRINMKNIMATAWEIAKKFFSKIFDWLKKLKIKI